MGRLAAGVLGAIVVMLGSFLVVAIIAAIGGFPTIVPDRRQFGWEGAQVGVMYFLLIGVVKIWVFPAIAAFGVILGLSLRRERAISP
jgi:hypothetical protein